MAGEQGDQDHRHEELRHGDAQLADGGETDAIGLVATRIAEYTPSGTEMPRATIVEQMTSGAVTVSFSPSWLVTVEPVSADSPKSPVRTPIQSKYWVSRAVESEVGADLGQPLGVTSVPAMTTARSPGPAARRTR